MDDKRYAYVFQQGKVKITEPSPFTAHEDIFHLKKKTKRYAIKWRA